MTDIHPHHSILDAQPYLRQTLEIISDNWDTSVIYMKIVKTNNNTIAIILVLIPHLSMLVTA